MKKDYKLTFESYNLIGILFIIRNSCAARDAAQNQYDHAQVSKRKHILLSLSLRPNAIYYI